MKKKLTTEEQEMLYLAFEESIKEMESIKKAMVDRKMTGCEEFLLIESRYEIAKSLYVHLKKTKNPILFFYLAAIISPMLSSKESMIEVIEILTMSELFKIHMAKVAQEANQKFEDSIFNNITIKQ